MKPETPQPHNSGAGATQEGSAETLAVAGTHGRLGGGKQLRPHADRLSSRPFQLRITFADAQSDLDDNRGNLSVDREVNAIMKLSVLSGRTMR